MPTDTSNMTRRSLLLGCAVFLPSSRLVASGSAAFRRSEAVAKRFAAIEASLGGRLGVAVLDMHNGGHMEHRADERFPMCSTFKFLLVSDILARADARRENLSRFVHYTKSDLLDYAPITKAHVSEGGMTISALCAAAIEYSDNTAANLLLAAIGDPAAVTRYARSLDDPITRLDRTEPTLNEAIPGDPRDTTSPSAMLRDMKTVALGSHALSIAARAQLEAWMIANTTGKTSLRAGLPATWRVGDKTGSGRNGSTNDIAICRPPNRAPIFITAYFTGSKASYDDRCAALAEVGRLVADEFS